ncbi:hypothetical protein C8R41DRAFT_920309 [Lentinula lateritia]|uniref:Uncharacterized protein n=1 Tax=Lentinula lateritia TaxID=40482 RepID=A0ABQ8VG16_9AGAR|nr:hypothetical protein C8R41DRAFT_920309 [Lentinula lateritia]
MENANKKRVVTAKQYHDAHELRQYCIWLKTEHPLKCFLDVYMNASNFFDQFVITNADWNDANECVIAACTELEDKRQGRHDAPKTYEWMRKEIDLARQLGRTDQITVDLSRFISEKSRHYILDEIERRASKGLSWTSLGDSLHGLMTALDKEFEKLRKLMTDDKKYI